MSTHLKYTLVISILLLTQGCQSTSLTSVQEGFSNAVDSVQTSWDEAKQNNAEKRAKWYYNDKPLMALKHKNGNDFNLGGKKDTIDGFREFKWSAQLPKNMNLIRRDGLLTYYRLDGNIDKSIGGAHLSDIQLVYFQDRLHSVVLLTNNDTDGQALLSALDVTFGNGVAPNFPSQKPWQGQYGMYGSPFFVHSNIFHYNKHYGWAEYDCLADDKPCQVTLYSKIEEYKHQEALAKQANDSTNDF